MSKWYIKQRYEAEIMQWNTCVRSVKRILVVCDKFLAESGAINYILDSLDSSNSVELFDQAIPDPTIEIVGKGLGCSAGYALILLSVLEEALPLIRQRQ